MGPIFVAARPRHLVRRRTGLGARRCTAVCVVRAEGFEPPRLSSREPKSRASASSATPAKGTLGAEPMSGLPDIGTKGTQVGVRRLAGRPRGAAGTQVGGRRLAGWPRGAAGTQVGVRRLAGRPGAAANI